MTNSIYLDNGATTPPDPEILEGMLRHELSHFGNPTSTHGVGRAAKTLLDEARTRLAQILDGRPEDVTFTSGGTEAVALGLIGLSGE